MAISDDPEGYDGVDPFLRRIHENPIGSQFSLIHLIGSGSCGKVYLGQSRSGEAVAIKLEYDRLYPSLLNEEIEVYKSLAGLTGFPQLYWHGEHDDFRCLVMELLGPNLEDLLRYCGGTFSLKTTLMLANQLLDRFETLHTHRYLHRDIKPENFLLGSGVCGNMVYMTDLGLMTWISDRNEVEVESGLTKNNRAREPQLLGTGRYASINGHFGGAKSRYDDLEALGYMLVYFQKGRLPWQGLSDRPDEVKYRKVLQIKQDTTIKALCKGLPLAFHKYMEYVCVLKPDRVPDYQYLRDLFSQLFRAQDFDADNVVVQEKIPPAVVGSHIYDKISDKHLRSPVDLLTMVSSFITADVATLDD